MEESPGTDEPFVAINIASLRLDTTTGFDLYIRVRPNDPLVLYARANVPFSDKARKRLIQSKVERLYIDEGQETQYRRYLASNLSAILADPAISTENKAEILHTSAQGLVREILDDPRIEGGIDRTKEVMRNTIGFLFGQKGAVRQMIVGASYDYYMYTHSVNGCVFAIALAQRTIVRDKRKLQDLGNGVLLRDIGMAQLSAALVDKPGTLDAHEFDMLRQHPILGEQILFEQGGLSSDALGVVRHHHEKLDGTGYPDGISGRKISPFIRACTIADIFDALTTRRPQRRAMSSFDALRLMKNEMQKELDQDLLLAFIHLLGHPD